VERMINPTRVAAALIGALLWVPLLHGSLDPAVAGPIAVSTETAAPPAAQPVEPHGRAYLFRGAMGPLFSTGMDRLTEKLENVGITASVYEFTICPLIADRAIREYREDPAPIILIGHSMGGLCAVKFAETGSSTSSCRRMFWAVATSSRNQDTAATTQVLTFPSTMRSCTSILRSWT
jgi:hypothetical protein